MSLSRRDVLSLGVPLLKWAKGILDEQNQERTEYIYCLRQADKGNYSYFVQYLSNLGNED